MGQMAESSVLEIKVHLLCKFTKESDTEILLIHITFHLRDQDKLVRTSGNNGSSWKKFEPRTFLKLSVQIWSLLYLQSTQSKTTLPFKSPLAATTMYILMQTNNFALHRVQSDRDSEAGAPNNLYGFQTRPVQCFLPKAFHKGTVLLASQKRGLWIWKAS